MDWVDLNPSDSAEEGENNMSSLAVGLGEDYPDFEVSGEKFPKWSGPDEKAQKNPTIIVVDSPERSSDALPTLEVPPRMLSRETCASLENRVSGEGLPNAD